MHRSLDRIVVYKFRFPGVPVHMDVQTCTWVTFCQHPMVSTRLWDHNPVSAIWLGTPKVGMDCGRCLGDAPSPLTWRQNIGQGQTPFRVRLRRCMSIEPQLLGMLIPFWISLIILDHRVLRVFLVGSLSHFPRVQVFPLSHLQTSRFYIFTRNCNFSPGGG